MSQLTIEMLSEDILVDVFRHLLAATPSIWPILVWVCRRWRQIIFVSPLGLNLRLHCAHGTPILKAPDFWPALPIILKYGGVPNIDPPTPDDEDNIMAALKQSGRVSSISLTVTSSLLEKLSAVSEPLSELEKLVLLSQGDVQRTLPNTFLWGPRLRTLQSTGIAFPSLPSLLLPCQDLVDLQLHKIPSSGYLSPEAFANVLSGTPQLRSLTLHLLSCLRRQSYLGLPPPPGERIVLAALTHLKYRGTSKYLDVFVARIDAPRLGEINITLFCQPTMDTLQLGQFIQRTDLHTSLSRAEIETSAHAISISFANSDVSTPLRLQISCKRLDWQVSCMAQICDGISPFLFHVGDLGINVAQPPDEQDDVDGEQWLDLLRSIMFKFAAAESFRVNGELTAGILCALGSANEGNTTMLPSLRQVHLKELTFDGPLWASVQSFITSRRTSGRPIEVNAPSYRCHICNGSAKEQQTLKFHLGYKHGYRIFCSYCGEFKYTPGKKNLFREHLGSKHPEIAHNDALISTSSLSENQLFDLVGRHSSLHPPEVVPPTSEDQVHGTQAALPIARDSDSPSGASESDSEGWLSA